MTRGWMQRGVTGEVADPAVRPHCAGRPGLRGDATEARGRVGVAHTLTVCVLTSIKMCARWCVLAACRIVVPAPPAGLTEHVSERSHSRSFVI